MAIQIKRSIALVASENLINICTLKHKPVISTKLPLLVKVIKGNNYGLKA